MYLARDTINSTGAILESISDGVFTVDLNWRITFFNRAAEGITGVPAGEALGRLCSDVFRSSMCEAHCALRETMKSGKPVIGKSGYIINAEGNRIPISTSTAVLRDENGMIAGGAETFRDLSEIEALRLELEGRFRIGEIVSRSPVMQRILEILPAVAASPGTVLITGETGTGKELLARTIHSLSSLASGPFVAVNCGALPDTLLESELFGFKAGAFTGALRDKPGRFALARGGTIFLDEIGTITPALQIRLLRVLQEKCFDPLGSVASESTDARIITATNTDLFRKTRAGEFREDLYYRVNIIRIELPPLRNRMEDIPLLAEQFVEHFNRQYGKDLQGVSSEALSLLMAYSWPGNIRELENAIERAFVTCNRGFIGIEHLPGEISASTLLSSSDSGSRGAHSILETNLIRTALEMNGFNRTAAARELGIHRTTLLRRMKKLKIKG
jgi:PAS domain S-box-containing protein